MLSQPKRTRTSRQTVQPSSASRSPWGRSHADLRSGQWLCSCSIVISAAALVPGSKSAPSSFASPSSSPLSPSPSAFRDGGRDGKSRRARDVAGEAGPNFRGLSCSPRHNRPFAGRDGWIRLCCGSQAEPEECRALLCTELAAARG